MTAITFKNALGIDETALYLRSQRAEILGNNLANVDTPNFKARDMDFFQELQKAESANQQSAVMQANELRQTDAHHLSAENGLEGVNLIYRVPSQPSVDGNTVEEHAEMARFAKNAVDFEVSLNFLNGTFKELQGALRGTTS